MCGIAGFVAKSQNHPDLAELIKSMLGHIVHRGPDEAGAYVDDEVAIGTVRLNVIDGPGGSQPFSDEQGRFWLCFNGELYNYRELRQELSALGHCFRTQSDTEIALFAYLQWQLAAFKRFNGPFALCVYDSLKGEILLARDRFGKRPLFYSENRDALLFASEMKAFKGDPNFSFEFNLEQLQSIATVWTPLPDSTCFDGIKQLPGGHYLRYGRGQIVSAEWGGSFVPDFGSPLTELDALDRIRTELESAVSLRLRADSAAAVYLSGGLDSAIIAHLAAKCGRADLKSFSVSFDDPKFDEAPEQAWVTEHLGIHNERVRIDQAEIASSFSQAVYHAEVPVVRTAFVPMMLLSRYVADKGIKVVLTGEGADEIFLGYDIFSETLLRRDWDGLEVQERRRRLKGLNKFLDHYQDSNLDYLMGVYDKTTQDGIADLFSHQMRFQAGRFSLRLFNERVEPFCAAILREVDGLASYRDMSVIEQAQVLELRTLMSGYLLSTQGDRMAFANGVENRCPFLDPHVTQVASACNQRFGDAAVGKTLLRKAFSADLPDSILQRRKFPYRAPGSAFLLRHMPDFAEALSSETELKRFGFLDSTFCSALLKKVTRSSSSAVSPKEDQALTFLMSLVVLDEHFGTARQIYSHPDWSELPLRLFDRRTSLREVHGR